MPLLSGQSDVTPRRGLPVDDIGQSSTVVSITGETIQLYYSNAGVETIDAGQAAGVAVVGYLAYENIKNKSGKLGATYYDTSLTFTAGALTTEKFISHEIIESVDGKTFLQRLTAITEGLANGEYVVDYTNGIIYGKKTTNATTLAAGAYKIQSGVSGSPVSVASSVKVMGSLLQTNWDYCGVTWNGGTFTEVFTFKTGGSGGTTVNTVTVVYVDATKAQLVSATRT